MRPDDPAATPPQLRVRFARTAITALVLFLLLVGALAIDRLPGHGWRHALGAGDRTYGHVHRIVRHATKQRRFGVHHAVGNCTVSYRHRGSRVVATGLGLQHVALSPKQSGTATRQTPASSAKAGRGTARWNIARNVATSTPKGTSSYRAAVPNIGSARPNVASAGHGLPSTHSASAAVPGEQRAYLTFNVNGIDQGEVLAVIRNGEVLIPLADLVRAGLHGIDVPSQTIDGKPYILLRDLAPGIVYTFDPRNLSVKLTAQTQYLETTAVNMGGAAPPGMVYGKAASAFFNYALDWQNFNQLSEFSELGVSSHGNLYYSGFSFAPGGKFIRGLTNATFDNPARMTRWVLGDTFADGGILGGGTFLGGISVSRNFSLNPYFVRYPGVGISGQTLTPSTAEIYVNGHLVGTRTLPPGTFDITNIPVVAGGGTASVIVRDAFGRTQTISSPYYFATTVLQRGLSEFSYNLGAQRNNLATASGDYGPLVFVGFDRVGITDWVTAGGRLDSGPGLVSAGPTAAFRLGRGQLGINAALSHATGFGGGAAEADYTYQNRFLSFGGSVASESSHYATVSLASSADRPTALATAFMGFELGPSASLTVDYAAGRWRDSGPRQDTSLVGSVRLSNKFDLYASALHSHEGSSTNLYTLSLNYQIGRNSLGTVSQQGGSAGGGSAISAQQSLPLGTGVGYRLEHGNGSQIQNDDLAQVQTSFGLYQAAYLQVNGVAQKDILASGGLVDAGDGIMFTRAVEDGYAVIDLPGLRGVRGYFNNQEIGRTDGRGRLLVPNLIAYYGNRVEISDQDIPIDYSVDATEETVATSYRGGTLVRFPVQRESAVTGRMIVGDAGKRIVPAFGQLRVIVAGQALISELNRQGEFYLENVMPGRYAGEVEYADGSCSFELVVPRQHEAVTHVGSVGCAPPQVSSIAQ